VADGFHLWSVRFDREAGDIFAIQDELSMAIVEHLKGTLHVGERDALRRRPTGSQEAYTLCLKRQHFASRPRPGSLQTALRFFNEALPEAHVLAASIAFWYDWNWAEAEASFDRVLALDPGEAFLHGNYAWFLLNRRRFDDCLREIHTAIDLDPLMPFFYGWAVGLHSAVGQPDEALRYFERATEERDTLVAFLHLYTPRDAAAMADDPRFRALLARLGLRSPVASRVVGRVPGWTRLAPTRSVRPDRPAIIRGPRARRAERTVWR